MTSAEGVAHLAPVHNIPYYLDRRLPLSKPFTLNVRIGGALSDFVSANVGEDGSYENISEYIRDLIRRDKERVKAGRFERLKAELTRAFGADEASFATLDAASVIARNART